MGTCLIGSVPGPGRWTPVEGSFVQGASALGGRGRHGDSLWKHSIGSKASLRCGAFDFVPGGAAIFVATTCRAHTTQALQETTLRALRWACGQQTSGQFGGRRHMKKETGGPCLSAVFVDYDNIYLSLKRKSEEAAKRFAKDASAWLHEIESGRLITPTNSAFGSADRRIVMNRCYGNPVPRRNTHDNSTDMNSFPFVRHHFLRAGFEVVDCPPLTAQLKNSSDIRMVMDVRDYLTHDTYFDEFIILSGDADFTPVLHRLRAHARRTVIFANDFTAAPYTAISDGEVREADLIELILNGGLPEEAGGEPAIVTPTAKAEVVRREIVAETVAGVRASANPVPLEALADRALRALGHEKTIATGWGGAGSFHELLRQHLPEDIKLTAEAPYLAFDVKRHGESTTATTLEAREPTPAVAGPPPAAQIPAAPAMPDQEPAAARPGRAPGKAKAKGGRAAALQAPAAAPAPETAAPPPPPLAATPSPTSSAAIQQSI